MAQFCQFEKDQFDYSNTLDLVMSQFQMPELMFGTFDFQLHLYITGVDI